ncbi:MAG: hypothetical protein JL56_02165 [Desulfotomaculum sp. BICA1-6]|nr:MAG: hypothetical protein VR67_00840 [Peptococcaceae bacterium BRH_c8a]KJS77852.1 MAG: hypothetical protein JL56_02165 [Desulfotomaculum sp. BICA1-6]
MFFTIPRLPGPEPAPGCPGLNEQTLAALRQMTKKYTGRAYLHVPFNKVRFVIIDIETTGFEADNGDEVISLAAVVVQGDTICLQSSLNHLVNPFRPIPDSISELTGIHDGMVKGRPSVYQAIKEFLNLLGDGVIAGHALGFDIGFLNYKLSQYKAGKINSIIFDTKAVARYLYPVLSDYSLDNLLNQYKIRPVGRHSALGDCLLTAEVFLLQLVELQRRRINNLNQLYEQFEQQTKGSCFF